MYRANNGACRAGDDGAEQLAVLLCPESGHTERARLGVLKKPGRGWKGLFPFIESAGGNQAALLSKRTGKERALSEGFEAGIDDRALRLRCREAPLGGADFWWGVVEDGDDLLSRAYIVIGGWVRDTKLHLFE